MTVMGAVERSKTSYFMVKGSIKAAQQMISPSETIIWAQSASVYTHPVHDELSTERKLFTTDLVSGVLVVTDQRILFVQKLLGISTSKEIRLSSIRSIDSKAFQMECLRVAGVSDMIVILDKPKVIAALRDAINEAMEKQRAKNAPAPSGSSRDDQLDSSDVEQLQALKQLYDTGVITDEEFAAKKAQILNL